VLHAEARPPEVEDIAAARRLVRRAMIVAATLALALRMARARALT
jgi:hypothetical protein